MKKLFGIVVLGLIYSTNVFADRVVTFKCIFDRENYEYIINWHRYTQIEILLRNKKSKDMYYLDGIKTSVDITVIDRDESYNFKGFKNNGTDSVQHQFVFLDGPHTLFADLKVADLNTTSFDKENRPIEFKITSFDNGLDAFLNGTCKAIY